MKTYTQFIASNPAFQAMHDLGARKTQLVKQITNNLMTGDKQMIKNLLLEFPQVTTSNPIEAISQLATLKAKKEA